MPARNLLASRKGVAHPSVYRKSLERLLASKRRFRLQAAGEGIESGSNVVDLMDALKKSLGQAGARARKARQRRAGAA